MHAAEKDVEALLLKERVFRRRPGDVAYPLNHSNDMLNYDNWDHIFFKKCFKSLTMTQFQTPPEVVLDLGCGSGIWVLEAASQWQKSTIVGLDVMDVQPNLSTLEPYKDLARRIKWVHINLLDGLPFPDDCFDFVRISRLGLGVPEDEWQFVLEEVSRVMKPGAALEILEENLIFPYSNAFNPEEQFELKRSTGRHSDEENPRRRDSTLARDPKKVFSWAPMHLARTVQTVKACKEAIWDEYDKLHSPDLPPTITQARLKEGHRAVVSSKSAARESFDRAWDNWENDMADRIGMRDNIMFELLWPEPAGERPDWRVWRNSLDIKPVEQSEPAADICRTIRGFVAWKPQLK
ncbi:S-adenosyl-L-methionine-dependent methyltransferase [Lentinula edodes]|uniref:S-adenosyl-L-methionine-dependent methyltransferase n=1 Tax=Lentinula edodes TaxID=5353 RepID=A0A1Q3ESN9_LENED|nr:S-adenosyl-L-methionine-dependent methyltransferase [Lentinula edodes]